MNELLQKINIVLKAFNDSFKLVPNIEVEDNEEIVTGFSIGELKENSDGSGFVEELFDLFSQVVENSSDYELAFDDKQGIVMVKKNSEIKYFEGETDEE